MSFDFSLSEKNIVREKVQRFWEREIVFTMKKNWTFAKEHMKKNQRNQATHVNKHKSEVSNYQIND